MANLNVTYDDMHTTATKLTNGESDLNDKLKELKSLVDGLVTGGYVTDSSSVAFQNAYNDFNNGATQTISGLDGISNYLIKAADALQQTDTDLANALK